MTALDSLRKNAFFLLSGFASALVALAALRWAGSEPIVQPQSDLGILIGAAAVAAFVVIRDMRSSNGKHTS